MAAARRWFRGRTLLNPGTVSFDASDIDPSTVRLEGVAPLRSFLRDVATPFSPFTGKQDCQADCTKDGPDSFPDLVITFFTTQIISALGSFTNGECRVLSLTGNLKDGTPIVGEDVVIIRLR